MHSLWGSDGEKSITHRYIGNIQEAIKTAEQKFMKVNHRHDVQAKYSVDVQIGKTTYDVPEDFWKHYVKRH